MSPKRLPGLWRRGGVYQYRVRVPADLIGVLGTARINRTLGTASYRDALAKARIAALELELRFQCARDGVAAPSEIVTLPVATFSEVVAPQLGVTLTDAWDRYLNDPASSRSEKSALAYATVRSLVDLNARGIDLYLHVQALDTSTPSGRAMFQLLGVFSEYERAMISERVKSSLARVRASGKALGRKPLDPVKADRIRESLKAGQSISATAKALKVGLGTVHRIKVAMAEAA